MGSTVRAFLHHHATCQLHNVKAEWSISEPLSRQSYNLEYELYRQHLTISEILFGDVNFDFRLFHSIGFILWTAANPILY